MKKYYLLMKWEYDYDKEGTWFDNDSGERRYALESGASFPLPHIEKKSLEILSLSATQSGIKVAFCVDGQNVTLCNGDEPITRHVSDNYMVCGDFVTQSLCLTFSIVAQE